MADTSSTDQFYFRNMKWTRDRYGDYKATAETAAYRVAKLDAGSGGKGWIVYKTVPGQRETYLRPLVKTVKAAKERAERERYFDNKYGTEQ